MIPIEFAAVLGWNYFIKLVTNQKSSNLLRKLRPYQGRRKLMVSLPEKNNIQKSVKICPHQYLLNSSTCSLLRSGPFSRISLTSAASRRVGSLISSGLSCFFWWWCAVCWSWLLRLPIMPPISFGGLPRFLFGGCCAVDDVAVVFGKIGDFPASSSELETPSSADNTSDSAPLSAALSTPLSSFPVAPIQPVQFADPQKHCWARLLKKKFKNLRRKI